VVLCHRFSDDELLTAKTARMAGSKVVKWFACQSLAWYHPEALDPRVEVMPIGLHAAHDAQEQTAVIAQLLAEPEPPVVNRVLGCFTVPDIAYRHVPLRVAVRQFCKEQPFVTWSEPLVNPDFYRAIRSHQFVISPWGFGPDCYRNWESIYLRRIPLVQRNAFYDAMADLPFAIYDDLSQVTESWLDEQYVVCHAKSARRASMSYWIERARAAYQQVCP
jgi:hypothetical protein